MRDCFMRFDRLKWTIGLFLLRVPNIKYEKSIIENCKKIVRFISFLFYIGEPSTLCPPDN